MRYPVKTLSQLPLMLKGFRKQNGLTQAAMGERLGITQQSYAAFEANPAAATFERLFKVLRLLGVEVSLDRASSASNGDVPLASGVAETTATAKAAGPKKPKSKSAIATKPAKPSAAAKAPRAVASGAKKEAW